MFSDEVQVPDSTINEKRIVTKVLQKSQLMPLLSPNDVNYKSSCNHLKPNLNNISEIFDIFIGNITTVDKLKNMQIIVQLKALQPIINCFSNNLNTHYNASQFILQLKRISDHNATFLSKVSKGFMLVYQCVPALLINASFWKTLYGKFFNTNDSINDMDWTTVESQNNSPRSPIESPRSPNDTTEQFFRDVESPRTPSSPIGKADINFRNVESPRATNEKLDTDWMWDWSNHPTNEEE
jgi:prophage DNA circulation protein